MNHGIMFEIFTTILSKPLFAFVSVLVFWGILYLAFAKWLNLSKSGWTSLEFIWIFIGIFGIMTLVDENKKRFVQTDLNYLNHWIENDYSDMLKSLNADYNCIQYTHNTLYYTKHEFDSLQNRQDIFCEWAKRTFQYVDSCYKTEEKLIGKLPTLPINNKEEFYPYEQIILWKDNINKNLILKKDAEEIIQDHFWTDFKLSLGLLLVYFAFGLRLAITSNKLKNEKTSKDTHKV